MSFLADPCSCGWAFDEILDGDIAIGKFCTRCKRRMERRSWGWEQAVPLDQIEKPEVCEHNRLLKDFGQNENSCPHCARACIVTVMDS